MKAILIAGLILLAYIIVGSETLAQSDVQAVAQDIEAAKPYVWEFLAVCAIFASLTITNWFKKRRWFPQFLCEIKKSKPRNGKVFEYKQLKGGLLDLIAIVLTFAGVAICLYQRYPDIQQIIIIAALSCILQWKIVKIILARAHKNDTGIAAILKDGLYVPEDAPMYTKIAAIATGGGIDKVDRTKFLPLDERAGENFKRPDGAPVDYSSEDDTPTPK